MGWNKRASDGWMNVDGIGGERAVELCHHHHPFPAHETEVEMRFTLKSFFIWFGPQMSNRVKVAAMRGRGREKWILLNFDFCGGGGGWGHFNSWWCLVKDSDRLLRGMCAGGRAGGWQMEAQTTGRVVGIASWDTHRQHCLLEVEDWNWGWQ